MNKLPTVRLPALAAPNVIRPVSLDGGEFACRAINMVAPTLQEAAQFARNGAVACAAVVGTGIESISSAHAFASTIKDVGAEGAKLAARAGGFERAVEAAGRNARLAGQIGFDLVRQRVEYSRAQEIARVMKSPAAESALAFMKGPLLETEAAFAQTRSFQNGYRDLALRLEPSFVGKSALAVERGAERLLGQGLMSRLKPILPKIGKFIGVTGIFVASIKGYQGAPTDSIAGKVAYGAGAGVMAFAVDKVIYKNPVIALADASIVNYAKALGASKEAAETLTISSFYDDSARIIGAYAHAIATRDTAPLDRVHKHNMSANANIVIRGYAQLGEALTRSSLVDKAMTDVVDWMYDVPTEYRTSSSWWEAIRSDAGSVADLGASVVEAVGSLRKN